VSRNFSVVYDGTGKPNLVFRRRGAAFPVYSRRELQREPGRPAGGPRVRPAGGGRVRIFPGLGLGYHIIPYLEGEDLLLVVEPDGELLDAVQGLDPVRRVLSHPRVTLYGGGDAGRFARALAGSYHLLFHDAVEVRGLPSLRRIPRYRDLERELARRVDAMASDGLTIGRFARRWVVNFLDNLPSAGGSVATVSSLYGRGRGTALIAGAGPSLDRVLADLRARRRGCYLVAVDAAVMPLLASGIAPDLVVTLDPQPAVYLHFRGLDRGTAAALFREVPVVASFLSPPPLFGLFARRYLFATPHPLFHTPAARAGPETGMWEEVCFSCRAVSSLAFQVASAMGFDRIVLAGMDFAYPGLRCYASRSYFYGYASASARRTFPLPQREALVIRGGRVEGGLRSSAVLGSYRLELEALIQGAGAEVTRWSPGGGGGGGTRAREAPAGGAPDGWAPIRGCADLDRPPLPGGSAVPGGASVRIPRPGRETLLSEPVLMTLALRERLYRGAGSRGESLAAARALLEKIASGRLR
jgi:hypothetical protein